MAVKIDIGAVAPHYTSDSSSKQNASGKDTREPVASIGTAAAHATFPSWMSVILMVSLIFGGCCANVRYWARRYEGAWHVANSI